jgi:soluble lytic murein transglycosylase-like protein
MPTPDGRPSPAIDSAQEPTVERRHSAGNVYTNVRRRSVEKPRRRWRSIAFAIGHGLAASILLAAGTLFTLHQQHPTYVKPLEVLQLPAAVVEATTATEQTFRVSQVLRKYTKDSVRANRIATALVSEGQKKNLDPALLIGVLLTENAKLDPMARSNVSARGLMQVMPFHAGKWKDCPSRDLANVESNICYGTSILAQYIKRAPSLERALLNYNGCVRGTNTPRCHTYSGKVLKFADQAASAMLKVPFIDTE